MLRHFIGGAFSTLLFGIIGIIIAGIAFRVFDLLMPFSVAKEIAEEKNIAVAVVIAALFIALAIIIGAAIP